MLVGVWRMRPVVIRVFPPFRSFPMGSRKADSFPQYAEYSIKIEYRDNDERGAAEELR